MTPPPTMRLGLVPGPSLLAPVRAAWLRAPLPGWAVVPTPEALARLEERLRRALRSEAGDASWTGGAGREAPEAVGHLLGLTAVELQRRLGFAVATGGAVPGAGPQVLAAWWAYSQPGAGLEAGRAAARLLDRLGRDLGAPDPDPRALEAMVEEAIGPLRAAVLEASVTLMTNEADRRGVAWTLEEPASRVVAYGHGRARRRMVGTLPEGQGQLVRLVTGDRRLAASLLHRAGLPVPALAVARTADEAVAAAGRIGWPVAILPAGPGQGREAAAGLDGPEALRAAFEQRHRAGQPVLVERSLPGRRHRILVLEGRAVAVVQLPAPGRDVTAVAHPEVLALAEEAARLFPGPMLGFDAVAVDITRPPSEGGFAVLGVDCAPSLSIHARAEPPRDLSGAALDLLLGPSGGRIPIVAALCGASAPAPAGLDLLERILAAEGRAVGRARADGTARADGWALPAAGAREADPWRRAPARVLADPRVEVALVEIGRDDLAVGLPFGRADVALLLPGPAGAAEIGVLVQLARSVVAPLASRREGPGPMLPPGAPPPLVLLAADLDTEAAAVEAAVEAGATVLGWRRDAAAGLVLAGPGLVDRLTGPDALPPAGLSPAAALHHAPLVAAAVLAALGRAPAEIRRLLDEATARPA